MDREETRPPAGTISPPGVWWLALSAVTVLALALRFFAIGRQSFWYDEAVAAACIRASYGEIVTGVWRDNGNPPLYWLLVKAWASRAGDSETGLRSLSALLGAFTVPFLGLLGRRLVGSAPGLLAAGLLAISPMAVELSNDSRAYALSGLLAVACTACFVRWFDDRRAMNLVVYSLCMAACWYTHYFLFTMAAAHGTALLLLPGRRRLLVPWVGALAFASLLWAPWTPVFVAQLRTPGNLSRLADRWQTQFLATPLVFGFGRSLAWRESGSAVLGLSTAAAAVTFWLPALGGLVTLRTRRSVAGMLGVWAFLPIAGPLAVALTLTPIYMTRYAYLGLPAFLLLAAVGLSASGARTRGVALALIVGLTTVSLYRYATLPLKDDWRSAEALVRAGLRGGELVVVDPHVESAPFLYYAHRKGLPGTVAVKYDTPVAGGSGRVALVYLTSPSPADLGVKTLNERLAEARGVWLALRLPETPPESYLAHFKGLGFDLKSEQKLYQIDVFHFVRPGSGRGAD